MSANYCADWRDIFRGQVREIQTHYPAAHAALRNWGRWSRELHGIFPQIAQPGWTEFYRAPQEWAEDPVALAPLPAAPQNARSERDREERADERSGVELDIRVHALHFPTIWRRVLRAAYVTIEVPEDQFPTIAKVGAQGFLTFLDSALEHLDGALR